MLYTKQQAQANIRNREGKRVFYLAKGDTLTSEARDWLNSQRISVLPAQEARKTAYRLLNGAVIEGKPENLTHLNAEVLVAKTHPRIRFRGAVDHLEAALLLCQKRVPHLQKQLQEVLDLARRLIRCDVLDEPVGEITLCGLTQQEQRQRSHIPQQYYGIAHFMPDSTDKDSILELNLVRTLVRSTEWQALEAFSDREGNPTRPDILQALNRMSSMLYILMLQEKGG